MSDHRRQLEALFHDALERPSHERPGFLDSACHGDSGLRAELESLLTADDCAVEFLEQAAPAAAAGFDQTAIAAMPFGPPGAGVGQQVGDYTLLRVLASGGMGVVYEAEQGQPRRRVALKLMRAGLTSRSGLRRFEDEAQILARLSHPGIAQIYEAGTHQESGQFVPYFAMEYIQEAQPLTEYAEGRRLSSRDRMRMFMAVCDAVHYGHQRGVIHRDLKPGNILVDSAGRPKVIDFGVARATDADRPGTTLHTNVGQLIGTISYMSPEQCDFDPHAIDVRSDVYSLGVLLYELLSGQLPYDVREAPLAAAARIIQEQVPRRLSSVNRVLRGDVETIVRKALEKDPAARYQSAADFGRDVARYLENRPIEARAPSAIYQVRKLISRHRSVSVLVIAFLISLGAFGAAMSVLYARADAHRRTAQTAQQQAHAQAVIAQRVAASLEAIIRGLASPPMVGNADAADAAPQTLAREDVLDKCATEIQRELRGEPLSQARLMDALGNAYRTLGRGDKARRLLESALALRRSALPDPHLDLATSLFSLALLDESGGDDESAERLHRDALRMRLALLGNGGSPVQDSRLALHQVLLRRHDFEGAKTLLLDCLAAYRTMPSVSDDAMAGILHRIGTLLIEKGDFQEAETALNESIQLRRRHPSASTDEMIVNGWLILGSLEYKRGHYTESLALFRAALPPMREHAGDRSTRTVHLLNNIALTEGLCGDFDEALALFDQVLRTKREILGPDHHSVGHTLFDLSTVLYAKGDRPQSRSAALQAAEILRASPAAGRDAFLAATLCRLADLDLDDGEFQSAESLAREAIALREAIYPHDHWQMAEARNLLARCLAASGRAAEARPMLQESYAVLDRVFAGSIPTRMGARAE